MLRALAERLPAGSLAQADFALFRDELIFFIGRAEALLTDNPLGQVRTVVVRRERGDGREGCMNVGQVDVPRPKTCTPVKRSSRKMGHNLGKGGGQEAMGRGQVPQNITPWDGCARYLLCWWPGWRALRRFSAQLVLGVAGWGEAPAVLPSLTAMLTLRAEVASLIAIVCTGEQTRRWGGGGAREQKEKIER